MTDEPQAKEMDGLALLRSKIARWFYLYISRRIPRLVWINDEIDIRITFFEDQINQTDPMRGLFSGGLFEIEKQLHHMGIRFDTGQGLGGRDWEWDWALSGPVSVVFKGLAKKPDLRRARPKLKCVK